MSIFSVVVMGGIFVFLVVHVIWFLIAHGGVNLFNRHGYVHVSHPQVIPTLFSIQNVDDSSSGVPLVNALHNPLYDELRQASFHYDSRNSGHLKEGEEAVALTVDRQELHGGDPLTVSWKYGRNHRGRPVLQPQDVMALYCHNGADDADLTASLIQSTTQLLEIATIAEIQATHQQTILEQQLKNKDKTTSTHHVMRNSKGGKKDNQSIWFIPHFPVYRYSTCEFIVYQRKNVGPALSTPTTQLHYLASSGPIHLTSVTSPFGIHLSGTEHPTEMRVSFSTGSSGTPVASFGTENPPKTNRVTTGTSTTYGASDLCMEPANLTEPGKFSSPGILHTVVMTNLQPNTTYYYKVGLEHGQGVAWSQVFSYVSPLLPGDDSSFSYLVYGDQGCPLDGWSKGGAWTAALAKTQVPQVRAVHHFGDLSYARGAAHMWDAWLAMVEPYASKLPYHVAVGNHEYDYTAGGGDGKDPSGAGLENGFHPEWGNFGDDSGGVRVVLLRHWEPDGKVVVFRCQTKIFTPRFVHIFLFIRNAAFQQQSALPCPTRLIAMVYFGIPMSLEVFILLSCHLNMDYSLVLDNSNGWWQIWHRSTELSRLGWWWKYIDHFTNQKRRGTRMQ